MSVNEKYPLALPKDTILDGQYIIEDVLGQGGFGITYRAMNHKSGYRVAVKEFFPDTMATRIQTKVTAFTGERGESFEYGKGCFLQEAETLAEFIGNENIVKIQSYFEENGTAYFVMDYVEGISFDEYIKEKGGSVSCEEAEKILVPIMDALSLVHSKGIIHRDVTPDNIFITTEGVVKLLDFGAARYSLGDKSQSLDVVLKHGFAPKEQYTRRGKQGPYTDVYTLGASFYFAITGKHPPDSIDRLEEDELIPPADLGINISGKKEAAILTAMSVQPKDRFQKMEDFKNALMDKVEVSEPLPLRSAQEPDLKSPVTSALGPESKAQKSVMEPSVTLVMETAPKTQKSVMEPPAASALELAPKAQKSVMEPPAASALEPEPKAQKSVMEPQVTSALEPAPKTQKSVMEPLAASALEPEPKAQKSVMELPAASALESASEAPQDSPGKYGDLDEEYYNKPAKKERPEKKEKSVKKEKLTKKEKPAKKKGKKIFVAAAVIAAVVVLVIIIINIFPMGSSKNNYGEKPYDIVSYDIKGNRPNNINNDSQMVCEGNSTYIFYPGEGLVEEKGGSRTQIDGRGDAACISVLDRYIYYIGPGGKAYYVVKGDDGSFSKYKRVPALKRKKIKKLWVTRDGFYYIKDGRGSSNDHLGYIGADGGSRVEIDIKSVDEGSPIAFYGNYIFYFSSDGKKICRCKRNSIGNGTTFWEFKGSESAGDWLAAEYSCLYGTFSSDGGTKEHCFQIDLLTESRVSLPILNEKDCVITGFNVCDKVVYYSYSGKNKDKEAYVLSFNIEQFQRDSIITNNLYTTTKGYLGKINVVKKKNCISAYKWDAHKGDYSTVVIDL